MKSGLSWWIRGLGLKLKEGFNGDGGVVGFGEEGGEDAAGVMEREVRLVFWWG